MSGKRRMSGGPRARLRSYLSLSLNPRTRRLCSVRRCACVLTVGNSVTHLEVHLWNKTLKYFTSLPKADFGPNRRSYDVVQAISQVLKSSFSCTIGCVRIGIRMAVHPLLFGRAHVAVRF